MPPSYVCPRPKHFILPQAREMRLCRFAHARRCGFSTLELWRAARMRPVDERLVDRRWLGDDRRPGDAHGVAARTFGIRRGTRQPAVARRTSTFTKFRLAAITD